MSSNDALSLRKILIFSVFIWLFITLLGTLSSALYQLDRGREILWMHLFLYKFSAALLWILFTPLLLWITEKLPVNQHRWTKILFVHLIIGLGIAIAHRFLSASTDFVMQRLAKTFEPPTYTYQEHVAGYFWSNVVQSWLTYLTIIALLYAYRMNYERIKMEMLQSRLASELADSKLLNLRAQLQPHFLFNTMQSISALMFKSVRKAETSMAILSDLLRLSFDRDERLKIPLQEEVHFITQYIRILELRFGERLSISLSIDPKAMSSLVPPMILQPFIENSIKHGLEKYDQPWSIEVIIQTKREKLHIRIQDNGPHRNEPIVDGTGFANTRSRLESLYGPDRIEIKRGFTRSGFRADLIIPFESDIDAD